MIPWVEKRNFPWPFTGSALVGCPLRREMAVQLQWFAFWSWGNFVASPFTATENCIMGGGRCAWERIILGAQRLGILKVQLCVAIFGICWNKRLFFPGPKDESFNIRVNSGSRFRTSSTLKITSSTMWFTSNVFRGQTLHLLLLWGDNLYTHTHTHTHAPCLPQYPDYWL